MTETTTEPTTPNRTGKPGMSLHERLVWASDYHIDRKDGSRDVGILPENVDVIAAIERELIDAATEELRERVAELEIYKSTYAKELSACGTTIAQLREEVERLTKLVATWGLVAMERRAKHDALKARADALRDAADVTVRAFVNPMSGILKHEAINRLQSETAAYDAEPREETHDGREQRDCPGDRISRAGGIRVGEEHPSAGEVLAGAGGCADGDGAGSDGVAAPSPDRDGEPGEGEAAQLLALLMELVDRVTAVEHRQDVLGQNQTDMRQVLDRLDTIERRHRKLRKRYQRDYDDVLTSLDALGHRVEELEAEGEPGAVPTLTDEMVGVFWAAYNPDHPGLPKNDVLRTDVCHGLEAVFAALKAGGAK